MSAFGVAENEADGSIEDLLAAQAPRLDSSAALERARMAFVKQVRYRKPRSPVAGA